MAEGLERKENEAQVKNKIEEKVECLTDIIIKQRKAREKTEEAILEMLKDIMNKIKVDIKNEKKDREEYEETLPHLMTLAIS